MREILFRAKAKDDGKWIEGFPVRIYDYGGKVWEMHPFETNFNVICGVIPETIGQFTGLTDKNGKKIFEGDVVTFETAAYSFKPCVVAWSFTKMRFIVHGREANYPMDIDFKYEVIGNIHDNPELLGGAEDGKHK